MSAVSPRCRGIKNTWGNLWNYSVASGKLNLAISGVILLTFLTINPFQYRFSNTQAYQIRAPKYLGERMWSPGEHHVIERLLPRGSSRNTSLTTPSSQKNSLWQFLVRPCSLS